MTGVPHIPKHSAADATTYHAYARSVRLFHPAVFSTALTLMACGGETSQEAADHKDMAEEQAALSLGTTPASPGTPSQVPHLAPGSEAGSALLSWLEQEPNSGGADGAAPVWHLKVAQGDGQAWSDPDVVASGDDLFVNWADFPSVLTSGEARYAHWLKRGPAGGYDYGVQIFASRNGTWGDPEWLHEDRSPTEHGFVSMVPLPGGRVGAVWLDGRSMVPEGSGDMQIRFKETGPDGTDGSEVVLDDRTCECCQTDLALGPEGLIAVYRDRSPDEIRDIAIVRQTPEGWSEPIHVHADGWEMPACPVNGPAVAVQGSNVVVAWFTGAGGARVLAAFSQDGGRTFGPPIQVDDGHPTGRVDVSFLSEEDPAALVSWIEEVDVGDAAAEIRVRRVTPLGAGPAVPIAPTTPARTAGFPQMLPVGDRIVFAWTDPERQQVQTGWMPLAQFHSP